MATAVKDIEQVVRRVLKKEQEETLEAIQELSTLLTEEIVPRLTNGSDPGDGAEPDEDTEETERSVSPMSAIEGGQAGPQGGKPFPEEPEDEEDGGEPAGDVPEPVLDAFTEAYQALSPEQASALAALFSAIDSELEAGDEDSRASA
ncbi:MAG TPA: hypothetical protein VIL35_04350 [Vicinamibacterales bacterium]